MMPNGKNPSVKKSGRVLLADSHLNMLGSVHSLLEEKFESVFMVADERSLVDAVAALKPELVVVDLSLPGESEANIAARLMELHPDLRLIVLSVHDEPTVACRILATGASGFVLKRSAATDLMPAVETILQGGKNICPGISKVGSQII